MVSQHRQETKDRLRASHDYQINLKAELQVRQLHQKLDHLLSRPWERLVEIQEVQLELLNEMRSQGVQLQLSPAQEKTPADADNLRPRDPNIRQGTGD